MSPGAKVFLTLAGVGAVIGGIVIFSSKRAKAATLPASDTDDTAPPDVVVPEVDFPPPPVAQQPQQPLQPSIPPFVPPFPQFTPTPGPAPAPLPASPPPLPSQVITLPTPAGPVTVPVPVGPSVPVTLPVPLPDVLAQQPAGAQPPPPPIVPLPPIVSTPPGPVPVPPILTAPPSVPVPLPVLSAPPPPPPPPVSTVSKDTAAMVASLLTAEGKSGWNTTSAQVTAWQKSRGLVADGKYGPKSALAVAAELATIPIIRFWPRGSQKAPELDKYRTQLFELATQTNDPNRAEQLRFAAEREKGQSFGVTAGKAPPISPELQVSLAKVA